MDGTLVDTVSSWAWVHARFGESNDAALQQFLRNEIDDQEFIRSDIRLWWRHRPKLTLEELEGILSSVPLIRGTREVGQRLKEAGIETAIISGGIDLLAKRVARAMHITHVLANGFATDAHGRLTGEGVVNVPIKSKEAVCAGLQAKLRISPQDSAAVGNSEIDLGLFRRARVRIAFQPVDVDIVAQATHIVREKDLSLLLPYLLD